jgi:uncharacterized protein
MTTAHDKLGALRRQLADMQSVLVALSGGVDSSFLLCVAADVLGPRCTALTTVSVAVPEQDEAAARALAEKVGVRHLVVATDELALSDYARNPVNRCYFCKDNLFRICRDEAHRLEIPHIVDGANVDDLHDHRPGLTAAAEAGVLHPLIDANLDKSEIRTLSRSLGLSFWDRPASPCLSSRIPYGLAITPERLAQVAAGERFLRERGFREFRLRHHDHIARLELPVAELPRLLNAELRTEIVQHLQAIGFRYVTVDLAGFRSGSLNEVLSDRNDAPAE